MSEAPAPLEAAIFDMDGVLTHTAHLHQAAWKQLFDDLLARISVATQTDHRPFSEADYRNHVDGKPRYQGVRDFLASRGLRLPEGRCCCRGVVIAAALPSCRQVVKMAAGAGGQGICRTDPSGVLGRDPGGRRKAPEERHRHLRAGKLARLSGGR